MNISITSFENGATIPAEFAFGVPAVEGHVSFGPNRSPHVEWGNLPHNTKSLILICHDSETPSVGTDVNKEGRTVPYDLPRVDFFHWVLIDIPISLTELEAGRDSEGVTSKGKPASRTSYGIRGINSYTGWFVGDLDMEGQYGGYDGPCPPWNDERRHQYNFTLYAIDLDTLNLDPPFDAPEVLQAMQGHILDQAVWSGRYAIYPDARD